MKIEFFLHDFIISHLILSTYFIGIPTPNLSYALKS